MSTFDKIIAYCSELMMVPDAANVASYLDSRVSKDAQKIFSFGYFPNNSNLKTFIDNIGEDNLADIALIYDKTYYDGLTLVKERHATLENHNLIMPFRDAYGNIVAIVGRTILDEEIRKAKNMAKYKNTSFEKGKHLFGLFEAKREILKRNSVFVVEGQFDCIAAHDKGLKNIVALGSSNMSFNQCALLLRYTKNFILLLDNDEAGKIGQERAIKNYAKYAYITIAQIPNDYKDICEFLVDNSADYFNQYLK